jgi:hypothetical protein
MLKIGVNKAKIMLQLVDKDQVSNCLKFKVKSDAKFSLKKFTLEQFLISWDFRRKLRR